MNGAGLTTGSGASRGGRIVGVEASVHNKLAEVWGFAVSDRVRTQELASIEGMFLERVVWKERELPIRA